MSFNTGDLVICLDTHNAEGMLREGQVYEVEASEGIWVKLLHEDFFFRKDRFEAVKPVVKKDSCV